MDNNSAPLADGFEPQPLRSVHTNTFPALLNELGISLLVSTYQAGKLVMLHSDGDCLNTHFQGREPVEAMGSKNTFRDSREMT